MHEHRGHVCQCHIHAIPARFPDYASKKGPMDILVQTMQKEGILALYKGPPFIPPPSPSRRLLTVTFSPVGMVSPLLGIAGVNSLLFAAYGISKRIISPFGQLSLKETAAAGAMAGAANAVLASPVEMFKVRMQGQYGNPSDKRLRVMAREMWAHWGFRKGVMRGYWVRPRLFCCCYLVLRLTCCSMSLGHRGERDSGLCRVSGAHNRCLSD